MAWDSIGVSVGTLLTGMGFEMKRCMPLPFFDGDCHSRWHLPSSRGQLDRPSSWLVASPMYLEGSGQILRCKVVGFRCL